MVKKKILVIEDDAMIAEVVSDIIETLDHAHAWVPDGTEALLKVENDPYDLAIMDLELPRMPGLEVAVRLLKANPNMRILFMTGASEQEENIETSNPGFVGIIRKPFEMSELQSAIEKALSEA